MRIYLSAFRHPICGSPDGKVSVKPGAAGVCVSQQGGALRPGGFASRQCKESRDELL